MLDKLFFYDGNLDDLAITAFEGHRVIDAKNGYSANMREINEIVKDYRSYVVLTNQVALLDRLLIWDKDLHCTKLYFRDSSDEKWKQAERFTTRSLRFNNNIEQMYRNGEFDTRKAHKSPAQRKPKRYVQFEIPGDK